jgi:hypothetical protein
MRRILGRAGLAVATAAILIGLAAGPARAMDDCEGQPDGTYVIYQFNNDDGSSHIWVFECYGDGKGRFVGGG